jgi:hypothetical protein
MISHNTIFLNPLTLSVLNRILRNEFTFRGHPILVSTYIFDRGITMIIINPERFPRGGHNFQERTAHSDILLLAERPAVLHVSTLMAGS